MKVFIKFGEDSDPRHSMYKTEPFKAYRSNPRLVEYVESQLNEEELFNMDYSTVLCVKEFPDEATDWMIIEYDGMETLYYVLDGKIKEAE